MKTRGTLVVVFIALCLALTSAAEAQSDDSWRWSLTPYIWATSLSEDLTFRGEGIGGNDLDFKDLVDITEAAYTFHLQGMKGELGFYIDASISDLKDEEVGDLVLTEARIKEQIYSGGLIYRPGGVDGSFDLLLGVRYFEVDEYYTFTVGDQPPRERGIDDSYTDLMVGARYWWRLGDRWGLGVIGDVSSGGTDLIWTAEGMVGWRFGARRQSSVLVGYRHRVLEYTKADERIEVERTMSGPTIAVQFGF
jgi:hypothetical protein